MSGIFENLGIDSGIIIIILLILTIFLLVRNISMNMRLSRLERKYKTFMKGSDAQSLEKVFVRKFAQIDKLYDAKEEHDHDLLFIKKNLDKMFNKYGVEKYDAFDDVGGKLSFALALLDKREYRPYLKCSTQPGQLFFVYERNCKRRILRYAQPGRSRGTS